MVPICCRRYLKLGFQSTSLVFLHENKQTSLLITDYTYMDGWMVQCLFSFIKTALTSFIMNDGPHASPHQGG